MTRRVVLVEGTILVGLGVASLIEAITLILDRDAVTVREIIGPDVYVLLLGVALVATGLVYTWTRFRKLPPGDRSRSRLHIDAKLAGIFLITAAYVYAIGVLGYFVSSLLFLVAAFKCSGVTSWRMTLVLSGAVSACYYILFVRYCELIFPKGILF